MAEKDPNGVSQHDMGAKLDNGKAPVIKGAFQYFPRAIREVANLSEFGSRKYAWNGWSAVDNGVERYTEALGRHLLDEVFSDYDDGEGGSGALHATAVAWNALARLELMLEAIENEDQANPPAIS